MISIKESCHPQPNESRQLCHLEPHETRMAHQMLGLDFYYDEYLLEAARFISGKNDPDPEKLMMGQVIHEDDPVAAILFAFGIDRTVYNHKALQVMAELLQNDKLVAKSDDCLSDAADTKFEVVPGHYTAHDAAEAISRANNAKMMFKIQLGGKYSGETKVAKDPQNGMLWLIKPGTSKISPAAGVDEERASQAQREAAFYAIANEVGLGMAIPKTFLININEIPTAVMPFLPPDFKPLSVYKKKDPNMVIESFEKYRKTGLLHMWGILEWILGSADSHSNNILMAPDGSVALLDHGSTFAGDSFNPAVDDSSFIPYYLRFRVEKGFKKLDFEDRLLKIAHVDGRIDDMLKNWINRIDENKIANIIQSFGIDPNPSIKRLHDLKMHEGGSLSEYVNKLWTQGNPLATPENIIKDELKNEIMKVLLKKEILNELDKAVLDPNLGYKISHEHNAPKGTLPLPPHNSFTVTTHSPEGREVGRVHFTYEGDTLKPMSVKVHPFHQRRGIASAMYAHAEKVTGKKVVPSEMQTEQGKALWAGNIKNPQFGKGE